jgi:hypothetical protein
LVGLLLAGCSGGDLAFGIDPADIAGVWSSDDRLDVSVTLSNGGTLTAENWPESLHCGADEAEDLEDLSGSDALDIGGTWRTGDELTYIVAFFFDSPECVVGLTTATVWRGTGGRLVLCVTVPNGVLPEELTPSQVLVLHRDGEADSASPRDCL